MGFRAGSEGSLPNQRAIPTDPSESRTSVEMYGTTRFQPLGMSHPTPLACPNCGRPPPLGAEACPWDGTSFVSEAPAQEAPSLTEEALIGQQIGEYVLRRCIGRGGMGIVYEAEHLTIGRKVALKILSQEHAKSPHARNLLSEARAASAIHHRGIIDVFGFGQVPGIGQYLVMAYLEGRPLSDLIAQRGPLPVIEVVHLLGEVLDALSAAHVQGVIHRDLKPSNIFLVREVDGTEYVKVLDFGLAKRINALHGTAVQTQSDMIVGTPHYMAPEQALGEAVGPHTDLYAVGGIAFEMLTGRRPFPGRTSLELVAHHLKSPVPRSSFYVEVPPKLDELVFRLLAKEPAQRPASANEVARELRALLPEQRSKATEPPATDPVAVVKYAPAFAFMNEPTRQRPRPAAGGEAREEMALAAPPLIVPPPHLAPPAPPPPSTPVTPIPVTPVTPAPQLAASVHGSRRTAPGSRARRGLVAGGLWVLTLGGLAFVALQSQPQAPTSQSLTAAVELPASTQQGAPSTSAASGLEPLRPTEEAPAPTAPPSPIVESATATVKKKVSRTGRPAAAISKPIEPPAPAPEPAQAPLATTGTLHLTVKGAWADVWVDGQRLGRVPPLNRYLLPAGEHELELRNPAREPYRQKIAIPPNGTLSHTAHLEPLGSSPSP
jgi:serine/threonine protein kinase